ncbi:MAG: MerR family transcriptional regulator [Mycobacteriales bacterium]
MKQPAAEPMRIGVLADASGVTPRTIRYYESLGLLPEPDRRGAHRSYDASDIERLRRIEMMKELGLSLDEVAEVLAAYSDTSAAEKRKVAGVLRTHLEEVDRKIAGLRRLRKELAFRIDLCEGYAERDDRR